MSWNLRSRKTRELSATSATSAGPSETKASRPIFSQPDPRARSGARLRRTSAPRREVEREQSRSDGLTLRPPRPAPGRSPGAPARRATPPRRRAWRNRSRAPSTRRAETPGLLEVRRPDLDGGGARRQELEDVLQARDPADPHQRHARQRARDLVHHPHRDRLDGGAREAAGPEGDPRLRRLRDRSPCPTSVLMSERMSAPASRAARAEATRSGAFGESLTMSGRFVAAPHLRDERGRQLGRVAEEHPAARRRSGRRC